MLRDLNISNVAIIDHLEVEFGEGLNLLTGETGAGKSIIIDALGLALGARASVDLVRTGAKEALVEAEFVADTPELRQIAEECGIEFDGELILRRRLRADGASRAYVNDSQVSAATLRDFATALVTIHGQGEGDELLHPDGQLALLDDFAGSGALLESLARDFARLQELRAELERVSTDERERIRELDLLEYQIAEIEAAKLNPEEEESMIAERDLLRNAERLREVGEGIFDRLYASDDAIVSQLSELTGGIGELAGYEKAFEEKKGQLEDARYQLEDVASEVRDFLARLEADPGRLEELELRLDAIRDLQRKYGDTTAEVLEYLQKAKTRLEELRSADERAESLQAEIEATEKSYDASAGELSALRASVTGKFEATVLSQLAGLALEKAAFRVVLEPHPRGRTRFGTDRATFMISPNPGEQLKPLAKIASGGEQSRLMLAIKSCGAGPHSSNTAIFDEVDTGIGGRVAEFVGRKLKNLTAGQQVICITHLPQIAAYADRHIAVKKQMVGDRTEVELLPLSQEARTEELARMLGGEEITGVTRDHAREMLEKAAEFGK